MTEPAFPILAGHDSASTLVHASSGPIAADRFRSDVTGLADLLPAAGHVVNLCADRYRFAVGFAAALQRRQTTLLPSSDAAAPLAAVAQAYAGAYFLHDGNFRARAGQRAIRFPDNLPASDRPLAGIPAEQEAAILFTSGSTGMPVPQPRSWRALVNSTRAAARALGIAELAGASLLGTVPHQHSYGLESIMMLALQQGFAFHGGRSLLPADIVADLDGMPAPRILVTTPIHLRALVAHEGALPRLHLVLCATAPLSADLAQAAETRFAAPLLEIYGCSEVGQIATRRTVETLEWRCFEGIGLVEQDGDVWAHGPAAAQAAPLNDIIELKGDGRFLLHGRKSDMVNVAGKRNSLSYLNHQLNGIEGVRDGVFILPSETKDGARLTAYVVAPTLTPETLLAELRKRLDPAFLPRPIHFVDTLPRNALGKLTRHAMEQLSLETIER
ncbi:MAG TPA: AMP-binding protein [Aliidongia sp.]|nr:AMP-binding protein [Aliidongia sp.]